MLPTNPGQTPPIVTAPGPRVRTTTAGRSRNSTRNNASHGTGLPAIPQPAGPASTPTALVSPSQAIAYGQQLAAARMGLLAKLAQNRLGVQSAVLQGRTASAEAVATRNAGLSAQENAAAGSGRLGGSYDLGQRAGVVAQEAQQQVAIQGQVAQAREGGKLNAIGLQGDYAATIAGVASDQAAAQAEAQATAYKEGLFDPSTAAYKAIYDAVYARLAANGHGRGVQKRYGVPQTYADGTTQPTYLPGMAAGQYPT